MNLCCAPFDERIRPGHDVDFWIEDAPENRRRCEEALVELEAEWGATEADSGPVAARWR